MSGSPSKSSVTLESSLTSTQSVVKMQAVLANDGTTAHLRNLWDLGVVGEVLWVEAETTVWPEDLSERPLTPAAGHIKPCSRPDFTHGPYFGGLYFKAFVRYLLLLVFSFEDFPFTCWDQDKKVRWVLLSSNTNLTKVVTPHHSIQN